MAAVNHQLPNRIFMEDKILPVQQPLVQQWMPDERDAFISWLRSEFAAANAIIDAMCQHLQATGAPGEYDFVLNCVRQRRFNWNSILHMQQYFSVEEVVLALQQVTLRRQMHAPSRQVGSTESSIWGDQRDHRTAHAVPEKSEIPSSSTKTEAQCSSSDVPPPATYEWASGSQGEKPPTQLEEEHTIIKAPKCFQSQEVVEGRVINVVEGLRAWELFSALECDQIISSMSDLQGVGRKIEIGGKGYKVIGGKRFLKGKGSDLTDAEDPQRSSSPDETIESLPAGLESVVNRLLECQALPAAKRPDSYIINFLSEGGYLLPQIHNQEFEQPFCVIFLQSDCSVVFGRYIPMDSPGEFRSPFKLSLSPGTVLTLQGNAAKIARYALPALPSKRCCIVLGKVHTKRPSSSRTSAGGFQRSNAGLMTRPASTPNFSTMNTHHGSPAGFPATASPAAGGAPQGGPYPPMPLVVPGWSPVPRPPRLMTGTGVFLPYNASSGPGRPSSASRGNSSSSSSSSSTTSSTNSSNNSNVNNNSGNNGARQGTPFLQKTNSLPASFRTQNPAPAAGEKSLEQEPAANEVLVPNAAQSSSA